jgi:hypothetical protein
MVIGVYKDPLLATFEVYGTETLFSPLIHLVQASILFVTLVMIGLVDESMAVVICFFVVGFLMWLSPQMNSLTQHHPALFLQYPHWYRQLLRTTSREEQQRLAYMWLRLPLRTRLLYNTHDPLFFQWIDLVLLSMV